MGRVEALLRSRKVFVGEVDPAVQGIDGLC